MSTVFIGGSRRATRLPAEVEKRLDNIIRSGFPILVGDAPGADRAVQKHLANAGYRRVTVFCSGGTPRNNLGGWGTREVAVEGKAKGFQFFAAKDRRMAEEADFGLMVWDGASPGTALNVLRLLKAGKKAVMFNVPAARSSTFRSPEDWGAFLAQCGAAFVESLKSRATPDEWAAFDATRPDVPDDAAVPSPNPDPRSADSTEDELTRAIDAAFAAGDLASVMSALGGFARARGMSQVANETGLARESLYRSLNAGGNPEFSTVLKVMASVGLKLSVSRR